MNEKYFNFWRWAPTVASLVLMCVIIVLSVTTVRELKRTTRWREQTFQAILDTQTFEDKLVDAQSSLRKYVGNGQPNLLIAYKADADIDLQEVNELNGLTQGDPTQQQR